MYIKLVKVNAVQYKASIVSEAVSAEIYSVVENSLQNTLQKLDYYLGLLKKEFGSRAKVKIEKISTYTDSLNTAEKRVIYSYGCDTTELLFDEKDSELVEALKTTSAIELPEHLFLQLYNKAMEWEQVSITT